jgi:hypothetical protein
MTTQKLMVERALLFGWVLLNYSDFFVSPGQILYVRSL